MSLAKSFGAGLRVAPRRRAGTQLHRLRLHPGRVSGLNAFHEEAQRRAAVKLEELLARVKADVPGATSQMTEGSPLHALLAHVKESGADFVVIGSHGHGVIASLLLGSVAEGMVRKATVPTLVVPASPE